MMILRNRAMDVGLGGSGRGDYNYCVGEDGIYLDTYSKISRGT
jgi:hypothetical protein